MHDENHGRYPLAESRPPYICGLTGKAYSAVEVARRTDFLSRAISKRLNLDPTEGTEWDRVVCLYSLNTVSALPLIDRCTYTDL